jgi:hypothetical protein
MLSRAVATKRAHVAPTRSKRAAGTPGSRPWIGNQAAIRMQMKPASLKIGAANDPLETQADHVVDQVMRMPEPALSAAPIGVSRACSACADKAREDSVQRRADPSAGAPGEAPPVVHETLQTPGRPLDPGLRDFFEPRFGQDLSAVRVHDDAKAAESAQSVGAAAYAVGTHVVFGAGRYQPGSDGGRRLIAHELAHVGQQTGGAAAGTVQRATGCEGRNGYNCNGVKCTAASGRRGTCIWGGTTIGCNCRDNSTDEPGPARNLLPSWLAALLSAAALAAIAACFATGVCEFGAVVAGLGAAAAAAVLGILKAAGIRDSGAAVAANDPGPASSTTAAA